MIIGIDGNEANIKDRVGVHQYAYEIISGISKLQEEWKKDHIVIVYLKNPPIIDMPLETKYFKYKVIPGKGKWIITKLMPSLFFGSPKINVFFAPSHYLPPLSPIPTVCSIMDLGYLNSSEQFKKYDFWQLKLWTARSLYMAKKIIAISNSTAKEVISNYRYTEKKVEVTLLAYDKEKFNNNINITDINKAKKKYSIDGNYILFLSTLKPSKNVEGLLKAFKHILEKENNISLVIAGKKGWLYNTIFDTVKELNIENKVVFTGYVDEQDKPALIKGAKVFALPSYWEGFGLDVLNAMGSGIPAVISNRGSLKEVGGDVAIYVNPDDPTDIAKKILKVLTMPSKEYNMLSKQCISHAKTFDWENTARKTLKIIESCL